MPRASRKGGRKGFPLGARVGAPVVEINGDDRQVAVVVLTVLQLLSGVGLAAGRDEAKEQRDREKGGRGKKRDEEKSGTRERGRGKGDK